MLSRYEAASRCLSCGLLTHVQIRARDLSEVLLSAGSESLHEPDTRDPDILTRLHNVWTNNNIDPNKDYYTPAGMGGSPASRVEVVALAHRYVYVRRRRRSPSQRGVAVVL